jgi:Na+-translocating ferredoxin:NAD+ oxidoreductase RnfG subunit
MKSASYEIIFHAGIIIMCLAAVVAVIFAIIFLIQKKKINKKLDEEYGNLHAYNIKDKENS